MPLVLLLVVLAAAVPPAPPLSPALAETLVGRTAGASQDCISLPRQNGGGTIVDGTAIIYRESRNHWWVTFPEGGTCGALKPGRSLITVAPTSQLCSRQLVRIVSLTPVPSDHGQCALGPFVPYTRR